MELKLALAGVPQLVADFNPSTLGSAPEQLTVVGDMLFFVANDGVTGNELWKTDGTATGTMLVKDIRPGANDSFISWMTNAGGTLYFSATNGVNGSELWKSDGSAAGTAMVKDLRTASGGSNSSPSFLVAYGSTLYFTAMGNDGLNSLWRTDGTDQGTVLVKTGRIDAPVKVGTQLYFTFSNSQLWRLNLETGHLVSLNYSSVYGLREINGSLYFSQSSSTRGYDELYRIAEPDGPVVRLQPSTANPPRDPREYTAAGDTVFFAANDAVHGTALWRTDGTAAGTVFVKDVSPVTDLPLNSLGNPAETTTELTNFVAAGDSMYFVADDSFGGYELWTSDGTSGGTRKVVDLNSSEDGARPWQLIEFDGRLAFRAVGDETGDEWWITDGTAEGTRLLADLWPGEHGSFKRRWTSGIRFAAVFGEELYFTADDGIRGSELWKSDGTAEGTVLVADIRVGAGASSAPQSLFEFDGRLYFTADDGNLGPEVWRLDSPSAEPLLIHRPDVQDALPSGFIADSDAFFFRYNDSVLRTMLWQSDGAAEGTWNVMPASSTGPSFGLGTDQAVLNGTLYFAGSNNNPSLWKTVDTPIGRELVVQQPGLTPTTPRMLTTIGSTLYFVATDSAIGTEIWISDGTGPGTRPLKDIVPGAASAVVDPASVKFVAAGDWVYFGFRNSAGKSEFWRTDGTEANTTHIRTIEGTAGFSSMIAWGDEVYFLGDNKVWRSDGTTNGTQPFLPVGVPSYPSVSAGTLQTSGELLYLFGSHPLGRHLWASDGTSVGTIPLVKLAPISPGAIAGNATTMLSADGVMYVAGDDGVNGMELWRSDGTPYGTALVADLAPGAAGSSPAGFALVGNTLYFTADNGMYGRELWALDVSPSTLPGDLNNDSSVDGRDIDQVIRAVAAGDTRAKYDLNGDGGVDSMDAAYLVRMVLGTEFGDANLDGAVDNADLSIVAGNYASSGGGWRTGDFNGDGRVNVLDAIVWRDHRAEAAAGAPRAASAILATANRPARVQAPASPLRVGASRRVAVVSDVQADVVDAALSAFAERPAITTARMSAVRGRR